MKITRQAKADFLMILSLRKDRKETGEMVYAALAKDPSSVLSSHIK